MTLCQMLDSILENRVILRGDEADVSHAFGQHELGNVLWITLTILTNNDQCPTPGQSVEYLVRSHVEAMRSLLKNHLVPAYGVSKDAYLVEEAHMC